MANKNENLTLEERLQSALVPDWEQPYQVPGNWMWTRLGYVSNLFTGNSINEKVKEEKYRDQINGLDYIGTKDVGFDNNITYDNGIRITDYENFKVAPANTALLCIEGGSAGRKIGFTDKDVCFGNKLCAFVCKKSDPKLIYYYLQSELFLEAFKKEHHGLIGGVSVALLNNIEIPLPPLSEQKRIVAFIESMFSKLDEAKEKAQVILNRLETRKAAILHQAFTGELTKKWREEKGLIMENWIEQSLESICYSIFDGDHMPPPKSESGVPFLVISNVNNGLLSFADTRFVPRDYYEKLSDTRKPKLGDVLYTIVGSFGIPVIVDDEREFCFQRHIALLKPKSVHTKLLWYLLQTTEAYRKASEIATGTAQLTVPIRGLRKMRFWIPSTEEQTEIVRILDSIFEKEQKAKELYDVIDKIDLMKKAILARAFRGKLGTNNGDDESAIELLKNCLLVKDDVNDKSRKAKNKSISIPLETGNKLKSSLEREIYTLLLRKSTVDIKEIMALSRNTFDVIEAVRRLEEKKLVVKNEDNSYCMG